MFSYLLSPQFYNTTQKSCGVGCCRRVATVCLKHGRCFVLTRHHRLFFSGYFSGISLRYSFGCSVCSFWNMSVSQTGMFWGSQNLRSCDRSGTLLLSTGVKVTWSQTSMSCPKRNPKAFFEARGEVTLQTLWAGQFSLFAPWNFSAVSISQRLANRTDYLVNLYLSFLCNIKPGYTCVCFEQISCWNTAQKIQSKIILIR